MYFTAETHFVERFERFGRSMGLPADLKPAELAGWQARLREKLAGLLGLDTFEKTPPNPSYDPPEDFEGYQSQRIEIDTEPGVRMPFYILTPADLKPGERRPTVLALHGHGGGGKAAVAGRRENPAIAERIDFYNYDFGVQLVKAGFIAVCPDARGFGERRESFSQGETSDLVLGQSCNYLSHMGEPLGQTVTGMFTWDLLRLVDFVVTRPECDPERLGCLGFSGGGLQTLWLTIFDTRVKVAAISGYFYGYKDALLKLSNNCSCNYVPGLWQTADMGDLGALICPRPLLIESGTLDGLNGERGIANVTEQLAITRQAYALTGAGSGEKVYHSVYEGAHRFDGRDVIPWFKRWL
ncbi:MAG: hypothetical protein J0I20_26525 [Chloroflexi bacterium]|nr:hypothetical protein [Chloroflexota bacterium]OJV91940.1 MAG: hypothetical protein BGO39_14420 [Chloroflexi bacterium 54-19]